MKPVLVIAEAGVNHNGDLALAKKLVDAAKDSGSDIVKFQTYRTEELIRKNAELAEYQKSSGEHKSQYDLLKSLELSAEDFHDLFKYAESRNMPLFSTAFDFESLHLLKKLGQRTFKISSGDLDNLPLIRGIIECDPEMVILSTGASRLEEVKRSVEIFKTHRYPLSQLVVLHCTTQYPCPPKDVNLLAMLSLKAELGTNVGYSDHTMGLWASTAAVSLGARVIEKHLTLDNKMSGPDHSASLNPQDFSELVRCIRWVEQGLGTPEKRVTSSEVANRALVRKSIVAKHPIKKGKIFVAEDLTVKRPQDGLSPMEWDHVIGTAAVQDFATDETIILQ